jgi:hypothetical protein
MRRYRKGTSEASEPISAWRELGFAEDETWLSGQTSIGFADDDDDTVLDDMEDSYPTVYSRQTFTIELDENCELPRALKLGIHVDDGVFVWIDGVEVARVNTRDAAPTFDARARTGREARWDHVDLRNPRSFLREGANLLAIQALNASLSSADFSIDAELFVPGSEDEDPDALAPPTPGEQNSVYAENAPPQIRQVGHQPVQPQSGRSAVISARSTLKAPVTSTAPSG